jgi:hypothetical protein
MRIERRNSVVEIFHKEKEICFINDIDISVQVRPNITYFGRWVGNSRCLMIFEPVIHLAILTPKFICVLRRLVRKPSTPLGHVTKACIRYQFKFLLKLK